ncbi:MAG: GTP-binding protein [Candidatus Bathyarchaeia archaeon]
MGQPQMGLAVEKDSGNVEYKLMLVQDDARTVEHLATQMRYRLTEGGGEAFYELGVSDDGSLVGLTEPELERSLEVLRKAAAIVDARCRVVRLGEAPRGKIAEVLVRHCKEGVLPIYLMVPVLGNVDSGKSSIIGVLCSGEMDDGNGLAMARVARYFHEIQMRRTSSISTHLLGYDADGAVSNYKLLSPLDEAEVFLHSAKIISFVDLGGHERYLRTTLKGVMGRVPDYVLLVIGANAGVIGTTREHLGVAVALRIPVVVAVTKVDMVPDEQVAKVLEETEALLKLPGVNRIPLRVRSTDDVVVAARNMPRGRVAPIFTVSNTTGFGLNLMREFLNLLPPRLRWEEKLDRPFMMYVDEKFNVKGVGLVVNGVILQGSVAVDDLVQVGPFSDGSSQAVRVRSIHVNRVSVGRAFAGQDCCLALAGVEFDQVEKGMCLLDKALQVKPAREFEARITVLHHPTTIWRGYNAVAHIQTIRQSVEFLDMSTEPLRTGTTAIVRLRFKYRSEFIRESDWFVFREGRTRGIGVITRTFS